MEAKWYVVRTFSGHENKVKQFLETEIQENEQLKVENKRDSCSDRKSIRS